MAGAFTGETGSPFRVVTFPFAFLVSAGFTGGVYELAVGTFA